MQSNVDKIKKDIIYQLKFKHIFMLIYNIIWLLHFLIMVYATFSLFIDRLNKIFTFDIKNLVTILLIIFLLVTDYYLGKINYQLFKMYYQYFKNEFGRKINIDSNGKNITIKYYWFFRYQPLKTFKITKVEAFVSNCNPKDPRGLYEFINIYTKENENIFMTSLTSDIYKIISQISAKKEYNYNKINYINSKEISSNNII